jgi:hypothetical protein
MAAPRISWVVRVGGVIGIWGLAGVLEACLSQAPVPASCLKIQPTLQSIQDNMFTPNCSRFDSCHGANDAQKNNVLTDVQTSYFSVIQQGTDPQHPGYPSQEGFTNQTCSVDSDCPDDQKCVAKLCDRRVVVPFHPEWSFLVDKLTNHNLPDPSVNGVPMPYGNYPLCQQKIDAVTQWIARGAPEFENDGGGGDASMDASGGGADVRTDAPNDSSSDMSSMAHPDAPPDGHPDVRPDAAPDVRPDSQPDATPDAQPDATPDAQPDAQSDAQRDAAGDGAHDR